VSADPCHTYGPQELCAWKVAPGTFWFQTTDPRSSRKLDQRQDTRRVAVTGVNRYLRTYEMRGNWRKVKGIVRRYVMATNDTFSSRIRTASASKIAPRLRTAANRKSAKLREVVGQC
jgi:methylmalonyl-CoA mutase N-terminal domain/subunit